MAIFKPADILIPQNVDFTKWSVVACDQYTSEREYWEDVKNIVAAKRIGIDYAGEDAHLPLRFYLGDSPYVSVK